MKIKQQFRETLIESLDPDLINFWQIKLGVGGVIRTEAETDNINAVYLIINTYNYVDANEWLKFTPSVVNGEQKFVIDSVYSKRNLYGDSKEDEYRYTPDTQRKLIATYRYLGKWIVGQPVVLQDKDDVVSGYIYGSYDTVPDSVKKFEGVELNGETETTHWVDSDGDKHWSFLEMTRQGGEQLETYSIKYLTEMNHRIMSNHIPPHIIT